MTPTECVKIVALIDARCPASKIADATADAWYIDLREVEFEDGWNAALAISRRQAFVGLHDLLAESATLRQSRVGGERIAELAAIDEAETRALESGLEPCDRDALKAELAVIRARGTGRSVPRVDPRPDHVRMAEARAELEAKRALTGQVAAAKGER